MNHTDNRVSGLGSGKMGTFPPTPYPSTTHSQLPLLRPVRQRGREDGLGHELTVHVSLSAQLGEAHLVFEHCDFQTQLIAGPDRFAEFRILDAGEIKQFGVAVRNLAEEKHRAGLRHRFDDADAWENGSAWKVPLEDLFIHCHVLDRDDPLERFQFEHAINQQHWVTVWDY